MEVILVQREYNEMDEMAEIVMVNQLLDEEEAKEIVVVEK